MKFIIIREKILNPLQLIVGTIEKRQTMPILSNILLSAHKNSLVLTGTDLEIQLIYQINLDLIEEGEITVPARKFLDFVKLLPEGAEIKVELLDNKVKISSNHSRFSLATLPACDYPEFSETKLENQFVINAGKMKKALDKTVFCMANQDVRYYLNGLLLHISNSTLKLVSSDGHRLSIYEDTIGEATGYEARIVLPRKGVTELSRLLEDEEAELNIQFSTSNIRVYVKDLQFSAKLIDAKYPDFDRVFDQTFFNKMVIHRKLLKEALARVAILANEKFKGVTFDVSNGLLKMSSHNPEHDEAEEELTIEYQGEAMTIAFNSHYLLEAVNHLDSEKAVLTIASNASSCFVEGSEQQLYRFIVMPMRL